MWHIGPLSVLTGSGLAHNTASVDLEETKSWALNADSEEPILVNQTCRIPKEAKVFLSRIVWGEWFTLVVRLQLCSEKKQHKMSGYLIRMPPGHANLGRAPSGQEQNKHKRLHFLYRSWLPRDYTDELEDITEKKVTTMAQTIQCMLLSEFRLFGALLNITWKIKM